MLYLICLVIFAALVTVPAAAQDAPAVLWTDAAGLTIEGQGWPDESGRYRRLPERANGVVPEGVWGLSGHSTGLVVLFRSDSPDIRVRWSLLSGSLDMDHMPSTGVSGVDLYVKQNGKWRWLGLGRVGGQENEAALIVGMKKQMRDFALWLPLYNGVTHLEIGVAEGSVLRPAAPRPKGRKPIVVYGTSITQGGCASRPGMAFPAILGRWLDLPTINLGFSGGGRGEPEVVDLFAEIDASLFILDPLPNMGAVPIEERLTYMLKVLREKHPSTPVILMESAGYQNDYLRLGIPNSELAVNQALRKVYEAVRDDWDGRLYYVTGDDLVGEDREGTVDGLHPTDLGFLRTAEKLAPVIRKALGT